MKLKIKLELNKLGIKKMLAEKIRELLTNLNLGEGEIKHIPLYRLKSEEKIIYGSSILKKIGREKRIKLEQIRESLGKKEQGEIEVEVRINERGEMEFEIGDRFLAIWLQKMLDISRNWQQERREKINEFSADIFPIQYAHARCCGLLKLGEETKIIKLKEGELTIIEPLEIEWLLLTEVGERRLINQIIAVVDGLNSSEKTNWVKQGHNFSIAVLEFYSNCRIWGEVREKTQKLSQARLGLISVAQKLLFRLIQEQLRVTAITEL